MGYSVTKLLKLADLKLTGGVKWQEKINSSSPGIYIISLSDSPSENKGILNKAPISTENIKEWLQNKPNLKIKGEMVSAESLKNVIASFWLPKENILYIGATKRSLRIRLNEFYRHKIGNSSPHAGGQWLKTLLNLDKLTIYFAECDKPKLKESILLFNFIYNYSNTKNKGYLPLPFANLKIDKIFNE